MNKIITISREFGSGGRELAKRLAEKLNYTYYDKDIIADIISQTKHDANYIEKIGLNGYDDFPYIISRSFNSYAIYQKQATSMLVEEQKVIKQLAEQGNCIFVGRCADLILRDFGSLNLFVYATTESKINRCREKATQGENLTDKEIAKKIKEIDKARQKHNLLLGSDNWGKKENYHLCINTTNAVIKELVPVVADFSKVYFKEQK